MDERHPAGKRFPVEEMNRIADGFPGRIGFYLEDLATDLTHEWNADQRFPTASICKVPVMVELFRQVEEGRLSLDERRRLTGDISTHGSGMLKLLEDEPELTLRDYCRLMIGISDNMATDLLLEVIGLASVNPTMEALGFPDTRVTMTLGRWHYRMAGMEQPCNRQNDALFAAKMQSQERDFNSLPFQGSRENNVTTPREMGRLLKQLHQGQIVSPSASAAMIEMLHRATDRRMIARFVEPGVPIAHKFGSSGRIKGDVGIVFLPTGPLIVSAFALAREDGIPGDEAIAQISRLAVATLSPESVTV